MNPKDAYPEVPRELLRRPRHNKVADQQAIIDALVAALELVRGEVHIGKRGDIIVAKIDAALAMARKGG